MRRKFFMKSKIFEIILITLLVVLSVTLILIVVKPREESKVLVCSYTIGKSGETKFYTIILSHFDSNQKCTYSHYIFLGGKEENFEAGYEELKNEKNSPFYPYYNAKKGGDRLYADSKQYQGLTKQEVKLKIEQELSNTIDISEITFEEI